MEFRFPERLYNEYEKFKRFDPILDDRKHLVVPAHIVGLRNRVYQSLQGRMVDLVSPERESGELKSYARVKITSKTLFDKIFTTHVAWELHNELREIVDGFAEIHRSIGTLGGFDNFYKVKLEMRTLLKRGVVYNLEITVPQETVGMLTFGEELSPISLSFAYALGMYYFCKDYGRLSETIRMECERRYEANVRLLKSTLEEMRAKLMPEAIEKELLERLERRALSYHEVAAMGDAALRKALELVSKGVLSYDERVGFMLRRPE